MTPIQLYGNNIVNTRVMPSAKIAPMTSADYVEVSDNKKLTEVLLELTSRIEALEKLNEGLKKVQKRTKNE